MRKWRKCRGYLHFLWTLWGIFPFLYVKIRGVLLEFCLHWWPLSDLGWCCIQASAYQMEKKEVKSPLFHWYFKFWSIRVYLVIYFNPFYFSKVVSHVPRFIPIYFIVSTLVFLLFSSLACYGFSLFLLTSFLKWKVSLLIWKYANFLLKEFVAINFLLSTALNPVSFVLLCHHFHSHQNIFYFPLWYFLWYIVYPRELFNLHNFVNFSNLC